MTTGEELKRYVPAEGDDVWNVKLLPGEREFVSCGDDNHATRWNLETGAVVAQYKLPSTGMRLAVVPGGKQFVACDSGRLATLWDIETATRTVAYKGHKESIYSAAVSPDGKICVTCSEDGTVRGWNTATGDKLWVIEKVEPEEEAGAADPFGGGGGADPFGFAEPPAEEKPPEDEPKGELGPGHAEDVFTVCFLPSGERVVSCSEDSAVSCWNAADGKLAWSESVSSGAKVVACSPDGKTLAVTCDDRTIHLLSAEDGKSLRVIKMPGGAHWAVAWSADGQRLFSGGDSMIYQRDAETGKQLYPPPENEHVRGSIEQVAVAPQGDRLFAATDDGTVHVWDLKTRRKVATWEAEVDDVVTMTVTPDGKLLWLLGEGVRGLDATTGEIIKRINVDNRLQAATVAAGGKLILGALWNGQIKAWDTADGSERFSTPAHEDGNDVKDIAGNEHHVVVAGARLLEIRKLTDGASVLRIPQATQGSLGAAVLLAADQGLLLMDEASDQPRVIPILPSVARNPRPLPQKEIAALVAKLGHEEFLQREKAMNALIAGGEQVLAELHADSDDSEVRWRLAKIRDRVREGLLPTSILKPVELEERVRAAAAHPTQPVWAMTAGFDCRASLQLGGIDSGRVVLSELHTDGHSPACVAFDPDGAHVYAGTRDGTVSIFRLAN